MKNKLTHYSCATVEDFHLIPREINLFSNVAKLVKKMKVSFINTLGINQKKTAANAAVFVMIFY
jgi:hypothetical protein